MDAKHKILFLDIDGVLNRFEEHFERDCVDALNRITSFARAKMVLSSSWRHVIHEGEMNLHGFGLLLRTHRVQGSLIGCTRAEQGDEPRWHQIADWLKEHKGEWCRFFILDDDPEAFGGRPGVRTDPRHGLTQADAELAIEYLNGDMTWRTSTGEKIAASLSRSISPPC